MIKSVLYPTTRPKSEISRETNSALESFLRSGGIIQIAKSSRRGTKAGRRMASKSSKGFQSGTSGFAAGYPRSSFGGL